MTATLLAHAGHLAPHDGTTGLIGIALLLIGAATALWRTRRRASPSRGQGDDGGRPGRIPSDTHRPCYPAVADRGFHQTVVGAFCCTDPVDQVVRDTLAALEHRDWELMKRVLHPYVRWTQDTTTIQGRTKVLAYLAEHDAASPPTGCELRDGQIYRWRASRLDSKDTDDT